MLQSLYQPQHVLQRCLHAGVGVRVGAGWGGILPRTVYAGSPIEAPLAASCGDMARLVGVEDESAHVAAQECHILCKLSTKQMPGGGSHRSGAD